MIAFNILRYFWSKAFFFYYISIYFDEWKTFIISTVRCGFVMEDIYAVTSDFAS